MSNGAPTLSRWPQQPVVSPLPRLPCSSPWIDPELKVLIPFMVIVYKTDIM
jgi:hypothetical protein